MAAHCRFVVSASFADRSAPTAAQRRNRTSPPQKPSFSFGSTLPRDSLNTYAKLSSSATVARANSIKSVSVSMPVCRLACRTNAGLTLPPIRPAFSLKRPDCSAARITASNRALLTRSGPVGAFLSPKPVPFGRAGRSVASAYWGFTGRFLCHRGGLTMLDKTHFCLTWGPNVSSCRAALTCSAAGSVSSAVIMLALQPRHTRGVNDFDARIARSASGAPA